MKKRYVTFLALFVATSMTACSNGKSVVDFEEVSTETTTETTMDAETVKDETTDENSESDSKANTDSKTNTDSDQSESKLNGTKGNMSIQSPEELTVERVKELTNITNLLKNYGSFRFHVNVKMDNEEATGSEGTYTINDAGIIEMNITNIDYLDGSRISYYVNTDDNDPYYYTLSDLGAMRYDKDEEVKNFANLSFASDHADEYKIASAKEEKGLYVVEMDSYYQGIRFDTIVMSFEPETGCIQTYKKIMKNGEQDFIIEFDASCEADHTAKEQYETMTKKKEEGTLIFDTVDINGNPVTNDIIKESKVVLMNLWEPWCGPCVKELPELEKLYETYKDQGLLILGVYSDSENAKEIIEDAGVTYPILQVDANLYAYEQSYVPATFIFDGNGKLLQPDPVQGSKPYEGWEEIVLKYLPKE